MGVTELHQLVWNSMWYPKCKPFNKMHNIWFGLNLNGMLILTVTVLWYSCA